MNFADKLRTLRKQYSISQESLAEKLNVSRQAVTKWETGLGTPDIENLKAISDLFNISLDELLKEDGKTPNNHSDHDYIYESVTSYDIESEKHYDIKIGSAHKIVFCPCDNEKLYVRLVSNLIKNIESNFKVKIDSSRKSVDVDLINLGKASETQAKESLDVIISLPKCFLADAELSAQCESLFIENAALDLEFEGKVKRVDLTEYKGHLELDTSEDLTVSADGLDGRIDINQFSATSVIHIPADTPFSAKKKGRTNKIVYSLNGTEDEFNCGSESNNIIELTGLNSELVIDRISK